MMINIKEYPEEKLSTKLFDEEWEELLFIKLNQTSLKINNL